MLQVLWTDTRGCSECESEAPLGHFLERTCKVGMKLPGFPEVRRIAADSGVHIARQQYVFKI